MGMAPAQKAKKGRFGAGGTHPDISIIAFPTEVTTLVGTGGYSATASDIVDGDLTAVIDWTSDLDTASVGTGGTPTITLTALGLHTITVSATAATGTQVVSQNIQVNVIA
jgi:hypothetical protein